MDWLIFKLEFVGCTNFESLAKNSVMINDRYDEMHKSIISSLISIEKDYYRILKLSYINVAATK